MQLRPKRFKDCIQRAIQLNLGELQKAAEQHSAFTNNQQLFEESWRSALD